MTADQEKLLRRKAACFEALTDILKRLSGDDDVADNPAIEPLLDAISERGQLKELLAEMTLALDVALQFWVHATDWVKAPEPVLSQIRQVVRYGECLQNHRDRDVWETLYAGWKKLHDFQSKGDFHAEPGGV